MDSNDYKLIKILRDIIYLHSNNGKKYTVHLINKDNIKTALIYSKSGILPNQYYNLLNKKTKRTLHSGQVLKLSDIIR